MKFYSLSIYENETRHGKTLKQVREESRTFMFSQPCYSEEGNILMGLHLPWPCSKGIFVGIEQF